MPAIGVSGEDRQKAAFTITDKDRELESFAAAVQLNRELQVGSVVKVKNQDMQFFGVYRGTTARARGILHVPDRIAVSGRHREETSGEFRSPTGA